MTDISVPGGATALAEAAGAFEDFEDEFTLDIRVVLAAYPIAKLACDTSDQCGNTCGDGASACNSEADDPA
jgi:FxLD family lantipeptide